jgi:hypothetical protein
MVIAIGDIFYKADAKEVLVHYFEKHEIPYVFIEEHPRDIKKIDPSWLKMICHRILPGYDTIICWDLDLLPASPDVKVMDDFDLNKLCLARDGLATLMSKAGRILPYCPDFKYNGGLICVPKRFKINVELIFDVFAPGGLPWWEQCYLNNIIAEYNLPIHELPSDINVFYSLENFNTARLKHYTFGNGAKQSIAKHRRDYFSDVSGYYIPKLYDNRIDMIFDLVPSEGVYCEIGVFKGDFTKELMKLRPSKILLLDIFEGKCGSGDQDGNNFENINLSESYENLKDLYSKNPEVSILKGDSSTLLSLENDNTFDMIYIDGDHEYEGCKKDLLEAYKKVKNGGWLMGHDYEMNMNKANTVYSFGVRKAVDEFCKEFSQIIYAIGNDGCVSYAIKITKAGYTG